MTPDLLSLSQRFDYHTTVCHDNATKQKIDVCCNKIRNQYIVFIWLKLRYVENQLLSTYR